MSPSEPPPSLGVPRYDAVFVFAPAGVVTGGPEALHQLVDAIRGAGGKAHISYYPFDSASSVPEPYRCYDVEPRPPVDAPNNLIVVPEVVTGYLASVAAAQKAVWWLSVDHYLASARADAAAQNRGAHRLGWEAFGKLRNFSQSRYASAFLAAHGIAAEPLGDFLHPDFLQPPPAVPRRNVIVFPRKGARGLRRLQLLLPRLRWVELTGLDRGGIRHTLASAKIYADFGPHPGRDRMPREAAISGCCLLTGRRGSAANAEDVAIPAPYKLDQDAAGFPLVFASRVLSILARFTAHSARLEPYRAAIRGEREAFRAQIERLFFEPV